MGARRACYHPCAVSRWFVVSSSLGVVLLGGCSSEPYGAPGKPAATSPTPAATPSTATQTDERRPSFVPGGDGPVDASVRAALAAAQRDGRRLVVYVGATWCEPCTAFHQAVEHGELDEAHAGVRFLELDSDRVGAQLDALGYGGRYIPRFALPGPDGRGTGQAIEGGIKGPGAVEHIMQRLRPLLDGAAG